MKRIAVIFEGRPSQRKGVFNAVISRVRHLREVASYGIDVHLIVGYDSGLNRLIHRTPRVTERPDTMQVDGVDISVHWFCHSIADSLRHKLFHQPAKDYRQWLERLAQTMGDYDLVSAHDRIAGTAAAMASRRFGVPHFITWHGASIYTDPPRDPVYRDTTIQLLQDATCNFFVSHGLEQFARQTLTPTFPAEVLYNGADVAFQRFDTEARRQERQRRGIAEDERVVGFVGRMEPVKNVNLLADIYDGIAKNCDRPLKFLALGDGPLKQQVEQQMRQRGINCMMPGDVPHSEMPAWMNCIDVLVLPSRLEGFGLVAIEALHCGGNVVGSNAQGIPEVIGEENTFALDDNLVSNIVRRAALMLRGGVRQTVPLEMNWQVTAERENKIYLSHLGIHG